MLSKKMLDALNKQVNAEMYSSYLYLAMSAYFETTPYRGFASWMRIQASEEWEHAMKFYDYILKAGGKVTLDAIEKPKAAWANPLAAFEAAHEHELYITDRINKLVDLSIADNDHATRGMLNWFVDEQVEEVAIVRDIVERMKAIGDSKGSMFYIDKELGKRAKGGS